MKLNTTLRQFALLICFTLFSSHNVFSQCFQIESILVDACGAQEGLNEMVRFKIGSTALNTTTLNVTWPNNPWQGLIQNSVTASKVAALNADILDAGGCGQLIEPTGGILPANATVILVTSFNLDTALNSFGALTDNIYILFQNNPSTTSGHFANSGSGIRTLSMSFGSCSDTVSYDRELLIDTNGATVPADGATVLFNPAGTPTYINNGCSAPVPPFTVDAGLPVINACSGATIALNGIAQGQQSVQWSAPGGVFSNPNNLVTNYTIDSGASGNITLTLTITNSCNATLTDVINVHIGNGIIPNFATALTLCGGNAAPVLNTTSPNGITGIWNPSTINNTASGTYVFTPNPGQCATNVTLNVTVTNSIVPDFETTLTLCSGNAAPILNATSSNGITGIWNPATINNTASGTYVFTPNPGQCAGNVMLNVTVTNSIVPDFETTLTLCSGNTAPVLNTTSPNGITGIWNPSTISNTVSGTYVFTPNPGQCAGNVALNVTIENINFKITEGCSGGKFLLQASSISAFPDASYQWTNDLGNTVGNESALNVTDLLNATPETEHFPLSYQLTITTSGGCSETKSTTVYSIFCTIQKGISPNGDGLNDAFDLAGFGVKKLEIFNRYGTAVYKYNNYTNQWQGQTDNGDELPDGTYYYAITLGNNDVLTGWIYINRAYN